MAARKPPPSTRGAGRTTLLALAALLAVSPAAAFLAPAALRAPLAHGRARAALPGLRMVSPPQREGGEVRGRMQQPHHKAAAASDSNHALRLILSRRAALGAASAAAAAAAVRPAPSYAQAAATTPVPEDFTDTFGAGVLRAPGKLVVLPDGTVQQSPSDKRKYRALTLPNGLRVLLASDPQANSAAAALCVHVGHFSDPDNIPGMAHFCEHMLFLGTEKYPQEGYLEKYLSIHGGSSNAYTDTEDTCYFFDVNNDAFLEALDIFSQFFIAPLFTAQATDRELNAIESEHSKNLQTDSWRINQVEKLRGNQKHPYSKFGTGNKLTLKDGTVQQGIDLRAELLAFHERYYSANQMTLSVCGKQDLDTLQKWVTERFSRVENKDLPPPEFAWQGKVAPFPEDAPKQLYSIQPVQDQREIYLEWVIPFTDAKDRAAKLYGKPEFLISTIIGHEGKGSLLSYLKDEKGWVTTVGSAQFDNCQDFIIYGCSIGLTEEGMKHRDEIIQAVFSFLALIKKKGVPKYIGEEMVELSSVYWRFQERTEAQQFVTSAAANMHQYLDPRSYLSGPQRLKSVDMKQVNSLLQDLTPESCVVTFLSRAEQTDKIEKWYGTKYSAAPVGDRLKQWASVKTIPSLQLPAPNPFIPKDFSIKEALTETASDEISPPSIVRDDERWRVHYKADKRYGKPKAYAYFQLTGSTEFFGQDTTPRTSALAKLLRASLSDALNEYAYDAQAAGLSYGLSFTVKGPQLSFSGYNDRLPAFVDYISQAIAEHMPTDEGRFARFKDTVSRELEAFITQQPYQHAILYSRLYLDAPSYTPIEVLKELESLTLKDLQEFTSKIWKEAYGEALVQGNVKQEEALAMVKSLDKAISFTAIPEDKWADAKAVQVPAVSGGYGSLLNSMEPNPNNPNSASVVQVQSTGRGALEQVSWEVLGSILEEPFYADLRTAQQLGYIVGAGVRASEGVRSLTFTVQSSVADAPYLTSKVFEFLEKGYAAVQKLTEEELRVYVEGLVERKLEKEKKLSSEVAKHWGEVSTRQYVYDRNRREAAALRKVTKKDLLRIYKDCLLPSGTQRRVFVSEIASQSNPKPSLSASGGPAKGTVEAIDPEGFRERAGYLANETPDIDEIFAFEPLASK